MIVIFSLLLAVEAVTPSGLGMLRHVMLRWITLARSTLGACAKIAVLGLSFVPVQVVDLGREVVDKFTIWLCTKCLLEA